MTKELYLARHGETVWNVQRIIQGWKDSSQKPLTPRGIQQARDLGRFLQDKSIEFVLCGDLWRQQQTAAEILPFLAERTPIKYHSGLRERGATIELYMALFSYHFSETIQRFSRQGHSLHSTLTFEQLLAAAFWTEEEKEKLKAWHQKSRGGK